mmetsp:Transcript_89662/g.208864  ORF Transcript_89662/g.208864 Transcript_89662/m.208864 type:complete len:529 (-) Transcript_89662:89-1675(-)
MDSGKALTDAEGPAANGEKAPPELCSELSGLMKGSEATTEPYAPVPTDSFEGNRRRGVKEVHVSFSEPLVDAMASPGVEDANGDSEPKASSSSSSSRCCRCCKCIGTGLTTCTLAGLLGAAAWLYHSELLALLGLGRTELLAPMPPKPAPLPAPRPPPPRRRSDICNVTALIPRPRPPRLWHLGPGWKRACEIKNGKSNFRARNWCWVAVKNGCHTNLKAHRSWALLQDMAATWGDAPPRSVEPFDPLEHPELCDDPKKGRTRHWTDEERSEAREWFRNHVAVYVLGLFSDKDRWNKISKRLKDLRIWAQHIPGVDMRDKVAMETAKKNGWVPHGFNFSHAQAVAYRPEHNMGSMTGTLGCASAHFKAQSQVLADGLPLAVVFEDDSWPAEDFVERLWSLVKSELPCDWEVAALYSRCPYGSCVSEHLSRVWPDANEPAWRCRHGVNWGMQAVLYRTEVLERVRALWQKTVFREERPHCMDVDVALASISDQVGFYAVPAVQDPGFLFETDGPSVRWELNVEADKNQR